MARGGDYAYLSAAAARAALESGAFSAVDYASALLERIQQAQKHLHAFLCLSPEQVLRSARRADRRRAAGGRLPPLHGIPFAVKDLIDFRGARTSAHSRFSAEAASKTAAEDERLLNLAIAYQQITSWHEMHPSDLVWDHEGDSIADAQY